MYLHQNNVAFKYVIDKTVGYKNIHGSIIEKDYYVFMLLKLIANDCYDTVMFKGGTSLSKAYGIIERFSEDIDLCLIPNKINSKGARKKLTESITNNINALGLNLSSSKRIERHGNYNDIRGTYKSVVGYGAINTYIKVETSHRIPEGEPVIINIDSYVGEYMRNNDLATEASYYGLDEFRIKTVSLFRTFADKLFAVADYYLKGKCSGYSRHLYDLYMIINKVNTVTLVNETRKILPQVRLARQASKNCLSAQDNVSSLKTVLYDALMSDFYKQDYISVTSSLIFNYVDYEYCKCVILNFLQTRAVY